MVAPLWNSDPSIKAKPNPVIIYISCEAALSRAITTPSTHASTAAIVGARIGIDAIVATIDIGIIAAIVGADVHVGVATVIGTHVGVATVEHADPAGVEGEGGGGR
jgi:hypothetical protein